MYYLVLFFRLNGVIVSQAQPLPPMTADTCLHIASEYLALHRDEMSVKTAACQPGLVIVIARGNEK